MCRPNTRTRWRSWSFSQCCSPCPTACSAAAISNGCDGVPSLLTHRFGALAVIAVILLALPLSYPSGYYYRVGALVLIFALAALGLNLLMGLAGQVSLGHAA